MLRKIASAALVCIIFLTSSWLVMAQTITVAPSPSPTSITTKTQVRCAKIVSRISTLIANASNNLPVRQQYAAKRKQNLQNRINKLQQRGANVTQLTADFQTYSGLLDSWISDFQIYIADLKATQQYICGSSDGAFVNAVKTANTAHKQVRTDLIAFRSYYKNTLTPDFKTARQSVPKRKKKPAQN